MSAVHGPMPCNRGQGSVGGLGSEIGQHGERQFAALDRAGDRLQRADFWRRQTEPRQPRRPGAEQGAVFERIERGGKPSPDRTRARGRKLLRHNDGGKPGETVRPPSQRRASGRGHERAEARIGPAQRGEAGVEIGCRYGYGAAWPLSRFDWLTASLSVNPAVQTNDSAPMYTRVFRFAPSPNGYLHLGHAYSALLNHDMARAAGGRLLLRIEDIDAERAAGRNTRRRSTRISRGSVLRGSSRRGGRASTSAITPPRLPGWKGRGCSIRASRAAAKSARLSPSATGMAAGRATRTACQSIPDGRA